MGNLLDVQGLADLFGVGKDWVYTAVEAGLIPHTRIGRLIRFTPEQVAEILAAGARPAATPITVGRPRLRPVASTNTARGPRRIA